MRFVRTPSLIAAIVTAFMALVAFVAGHRPEVARLVLIASQIVAATAAGFALAEGAIGLLRRRTPLRQGLTTLAVVCLAVITFTGWWWLSLLAAALLIVGARDVATTGP